MELRRIAPLAGADPRLGGGIGILNGVLISLLGLQPFLVTLATWSIVEGIALIVQPSEGGNVPAAWFSFGYSTVLGLPLSVAAPPRPDRVVGLVPPHAPREPHPRRRFERAQRLSQPRLAAPHQRRRLRAFRPLRGARRLVLRHPDRSRSPTVGTQYILPAIAAVVIGGTSLLGGRGGLIGTIIGAFILNLIGDIVFLFKLRLLAAGRLGPDSGPRRRDHLAQRGDLQPLRGRVMLKRLARALRAPSPILLSYAGALLSSSW